MTSRPSRPSLLRSSVLPAAVLAGLLACAPADSAGDLPIEGDASGIGKADAIGHDVTILEADISSERREKGGKAIITSADSWREYFGTDAPANVDFDSEWVAFYGAGLRNTGGFSAAITGVSTVSGGGLILETVHTAPGFDCIVTQAFTTPHMVVKFTVPADEPTWAVSDHKDETRRCGPSNDERQKDLAVSLDAWLAARDGAGNNYSYTRVTASFFANTTFTTTFVVEDGVVVERIATSGFGSEASELTFSEVGDEVGTHDGVHPVAIIDDLYAQCKNDVLTVDEDENFINLSFAGGLLQSCTSFNRHCQDDCSRGPVIENIDL